MIESFLLFKMTLSDDDISIHEDRSVYPQLIKFDVGVRRWRGFGIGGGLRSASKGTDALVTYSRMCAGTE